MGNYANRCSKLICKGDMAGYRICVTRRWKQRMRWNVEMASEARALACLPASISSRSRVSWPSCVRCILLHYPQSTEASRIWKVFIEVKEILPSGKVWFIRSPSTIESCKPRENLLLPFEGCLIQGGLCIVTKFQLKPFGGKLKEYIYFSKPEADSIVDFWCQNFRRKMILLPVQYCCQFGKVGVKIFCRMSIRPAAPYRAVTKS